MVRNQVWEIYHEDPGQHEARMDDISSCVNAPGPGDKTCAWFNKGICFSNASYPLNLHIYKFCLLTVQRLCHTMEQYCRWKGISKRGAKGVWDRPPTLQLDTYWWWIETCTLPHPCSHTRWQQSTLSMITTHLAQLPSLLSWTSVISQYHTLAITMRFPVPHARSQQTPLSMFPMHLATFRSYMHSPPSTLSPRNNLPYSVNNTCTGRQHHKTFPCHIYLPRVRKELNLHKPSDKDNHQTSLSPVIHLLRPYILSVLVVIKLEHEVRMHL